MSTVYLQLQQAVDRAWKLADVPCLQLHARILRKGLLSHRSEVNAGSCTSRTNIRTKHRQAET